MKLYKAMLCDDDELVVEGLKTFIKWNELGIQLCGTCFDGETAAHMIEQTHPDILISDVRMPFKSGIELIKFAKKINRKLQ